MNNSRTSNSIKNIIASVGSQLLNLILSFVSRSVFIQVLGVEYLGISGLFNDVLSMLNMAELGFGTAMTFSMYKPLAENDYDTLAGLTHFYKKVYRIIALTIATIGLALIPFLPYLVNLERPIDHLVLYYILFLASHVASYLVVYKTTVLYADQKNHVLIKNQAYWTIAQTIMQIIVLLLTHNYVLYLIVQILFVYGANFYNSHVATKNYPYLSKKVKLPKEKTKGIFKDVGSAFIYKIATVLINATDNTLISVLISTEMVGYYSNYNIIVAKLKGIVGTIFYSLIASIGNLLAKEATERRYQVFQLMQTVCQIICSFCTVSIFLLEEDFIRVWLGNDFLLSKLSLVAIVSVFYLNIILSPITSFREAAGLFRKTKFIMLWTAAANIILSIVLGRIIGLPGILFATALSKLLTHFWYEPLLLFRDYFNKPCIIYFFEIGKGLGITVFITILAGLGTSWLIPQNWMELILKGILVAVISLVVIVVFYRKTEGYRLMYQKVKSSLEVINNKFLKK